MVSLDFGFVLGGACILDARYSSPLTHHHPPFSQEPPPTMTNSRQLLIFDINHVLVKKGTQSIRPYARETLSTLLEDQEHYAVAIWASSQKGKVDSLLDMMLSDEQQQQLMFRWDYDQCVHLPNFEVTRDLSHVWTQFPDYNETNTSIYVNDAKKVMDPYVACVKIVESYGGPRKAKGDTVLMNLKQQLDVSLFA